MFKGIFDKCKGRHGGQSERSALAARSEPDVALDSVIDGSLAPLVRELSALGQVQVSQAAKERGWAALERESKARNLAAHLADLVVTRNTARARALVASDAQASLAQMMATLKDPSTYELTDSDQLPGDLTCVTVLIKDRARKGRGGPREVSRRFVIKVRVTSMGAVVTAIDAICQKPWPREPR